MIFFCCLVVHDKLFDCENSTFSSLFYWIFLKQSSLNISIYVNIFPCIASYQCIVMYTVFFPILTSIWWIINNWCWNKRLKDCSLSFLDSVKHAHFSATLFMNKPVYNPISIVVWKAYTNFQWEWTLDLSKLNEILHNGKFNKKKYNISIYTSWIHHNILVEGSPQTEYIPFI